MKKILFTVYVLLSISFCKGQMIFQKTFGDGSTDIAYSLQKTSDGGFIIAGQTSSSWSGCDAYLIKINFKGDTLWTKKIGGAGYEYVNSVQQTTDSGYIMVGYTYGFGEGGSDVFLVKTDTNGNVSWSKTYGGAAHDNGSCVIQTADGGYIIVGNSYSFSAGSDDVYLIKTDSSGDTLWTKTFGGFGNDEGFSVEQTIDGGFIISGATGSFGVGLYDIYLIKIDGAGNLVFTKTFGHTNADYGYSVRQTSDGGYILVGYTDSFGAGGCDVYLIKTNTNGDTLWTKTYGGQSDDKGNDVQQTSNGEFFIVGQTSSFGAGLNDIYLIKTDENGKNGCNESNTLTTINNSPTYMKNISPSVSFGTFVNSANLSMETGGVINIFCYASNIQDINYNSDIGNIFPNPASDNITIENADLIKDATISIYNIQGQLLIQQKTKKQKTTIDISSLLGGIYFAKLESNKQVNVTKFVKE